MHRQCFSKKISYNKDNFNKITSLFILLTFLWIAAFFLTENDNNSNRIESRKNHDDNIDFDKIPQTAAEAENLCITEIHDGGTPEWVEIYNPTGSTIDLSGWLLQDASLNSTEVNLGTAVGSIGAGEVIRIGDSASYPEPDISDGLVLNAPGDDLVILDNSRPRKVIDYVAWGTGAAGVYPTNRYYWPTTDTVSVNFVGTNKTIQRINRTVGGAIEDNNLTTDWETGEMTPGYLPLYSEPVVLSEVMYGGNDNEWVEIVNHGNNIMNISEYSIYSYRHDNETQIPAATFLNPFTTYVIGEPAAIVNQQEDINLNDTGDVLVLKNNESKIIDVVCWGDGANYAYGAASGWLTSSNATGDLAEGYSIFRYNLTKRFLSDTNKSSDWYNTSIPTPGRFFNITLGDVLLSEIGMSESNEFIEIFNNFTWPVSLDWMTIVDYSDNDKEINFFGYVIVSPKDVIVAGESISYDYYDASMSLTNDQEDLVLYRDYIETYELDVVIYGDHPSNSYPRGAGSGWIGSQNATGGLSAGNSIHRIKASYTDLEDTNTSDDWIDGAISPGTLPTYIPPLPPSVLISEIMYGGIGGEWIEIYNNRSDDVDISGWRLYSYGDDNETQIPASTTLGPYETYVIGEPASKVDDQRNISLIDVGDVLVLNSSSGKIYDVVCWGTGASNFMYGAENGWIGPTNATGNLPAGSSIFRYKLTQTTLSDTNRSKDWYTTTEPTPGGFYNITVGDIFFSEIAMSETPYEFIEFYNNLTWPVTLDGMVVYDYGGNDVEITFTGNVTIPAKGVIVAGESPSHDYYVTPSMSLTNDQEDLVLYRDSARTYELDVIIYGNDPSNSYPWGAGSGWIGPKNATGGLSSGTGLTRINGSNHELQDTNTSADWMIYAVNPGSIPPYIPPPVPGNISSVLITELMMDPSTPETGSEYIELYNTRDLDINIGNWTIRHSSTLGSADATIPMGTILPAKTYLTILDDEVVCTSRYSVVGLTYAESITMSNTPSDINLVDSYFTIIDRVAWRTSTKIFNNTWDNVSWQDTGVTKGSEGKALTRLYDPYNNDIYLDTNTSADWKNNNFPSIGEHSNTVIFLSSPVFGNATVTTFCSPDNSFDAFVALIGSARYSIDVCVYQFTSNHILEELLDALARNVQIRLLMEDIYPLYDSPYLDDNTHDEENYEVVYVAQQISSHPNGSVRWESEDYHKYTHSKYFIIDNETIVISTENFKPTGIPKSPTAGNRGWGIAVKNADLAEKYLDVFNFDWNIGQDFDPSKVIVGQRNEFVISGNYEKITPYLVYNIYNAKFQTIVGPDETIDVLVNLIDSANSTIFAELFYIYPTWSGYPGGANNNPLLLALIRAAQRRVDVRVILDSSFYNIDDDNDNDEAGDILEAHGVKIRYSNNTGGIEKFHVKAFVVDGLCTMISSVNWNENSATNNREIGVIVRSSKVAAFYVFIFLYDWEELSSEDLPEDEEPEEEKTYFWVWWLPFATLSFVVVMGVGYYIRNRKETAEIQERLAKEKIKPKEELIVEEEEEEVMEIFPIELNAIRQKIALIYGDKAKVANLNSEGYPLDYIVPSQFVQDYIKINNELIEVGSFLNPISRVFVLKYTPENYIVIDSKEEDLRFTLFEDFLKTRIDQLKDQIILKNRDIAENLGKVNQLGAVISQLERIVPDDQLGKSQADIAKELNENESQIGKLKKLIENLKDEKEKLQVDIENLSESPLEDLVNDLQFRINKQRLVITKLKKEKSDSQDERWGGLL